jgi:hypothetical protein
MKVASSCKPRLGQSALSRAVPDTLGICGVTTATHACIMICPLLLTLCSTSQPAHRDSWVRTRAWAERPEASRSGSAKKQHCPAAVRILQAEGCQLEVIVLYQHAIVTILRQHAHMQRMALPVQVLHGLVHMAKVHPHHPEPKRGVLIGHELERRNGIDFMQRSCHIRREHIPAECSY